VTERSAWSAIFAGTHSIWYVQHPFTSKSVDADVESVCTTVQVTISHFTRWTITIESSPRTGIARPLASFIVTRWPQDLVTAIFALPVKGQYRVHSTFGPTSCATSKRKIAACGILLFNVLHPRPVQREDAARSGRAPYLTAKEIIASAGGEWYPSPTRHS
jgi:hypothetical protein